MTKIMIMSKLPNESMETVLRESAALGYGCVVCSESLHEETKAAASAYYVEDWGDLERLEAIAREEKVSGVIGLCDRSVSLVARIAQDLGFPGNPPEAMERLVAKHDFRELQDEAGVFCPRHLITDSAEGIREKCAGLRFPIIVKPTRCSSSFGQTVLEDESGLPEAVRAAVGYSRDGKACVEEFITMKSLRAVELDVFVLGDEILWDGTRDSYRLESAPLRPAYDVYPPRLTEEEWREIRRTVSAVLKTCGARLGEYDIEGFFTPDGRFFILEVNPRPAGYYNPEHIRMCCGVNLTKLLLTTAVGDKGYYEELKTFPRTRKHILMFSVFSDKEGVLDRVHIDPSLQPKIIDQKYFFGQKAGDRVKDILTAVRPVCVVVLEFPGSEELEAILPRLTDLIYAEVH